jgi:hypothetical protein
MPSLSHEALVMLFRNRLELAPELLRDALGLEVPSYSEIRVESIDLSEVVPAEYRADFVVLLVEGKPVLGIIIEAQLNVDARKRFTWPVYVAGVRARFECPAVVLVVTTDESVARWAAAPIALGPGSVVQPIVLGPGGVPVVIEQERADADPELSVLSAMAHGAGDVETAVKIALAGITACAGLPDERALVYSDLIRASLSEAARKAFEELMANTEGYEFQSEFARRHEAQGIAIGEARGEAKALVTFLEARGLSITDDQRSRILDCGDLEQLGQWIRKAATVTAVAELFE